MHLVSDILVERGVEQVWAFFEDIENLPRWDRSVDRVEQLTPGPLTVGSRFDTIAPARGGAASGTRLHYVVAEVNPPRSHTAALVDSPMFAEATWTMEFAPVVGGTVITCHARFRTRLWYAFLAPVLWLNRGAILRDLEYLKRTIEATYPA